MFPKSWLDGGSKKRCITLYSQNNTVEDSFKRGIDCLIKIVKFGTYLMIFLEIEIILIRLPRMIVFFFCVAQNNYSMLWLDNLGFLPDNHSIYYVVFELILIFVHIPKLFFRNANDFDSKTPSSNAQWIIADNCTFHLLVFQCPFFHI